VAQHDEAEEINLIRKLMALIKAVRFEKSLGGASTDADFICGRRCATLIGLMKGENRSPGVIAAEAAVVSCFLDDTRSESSLSDVLDTSMKSFEAKQKKKVIFCFRYRFLRSFCSCPAYFRMMTRQRP
jgi:hypothetical protein